MWHNGSGSGVDSIMQGLLTQTSQKFDRLVTTELTNHLFGENFTDKDIGGDLIAR